MLVALTSTANSQDATKESASRPKQTISLETQEKIVRQTNDFRKQHDRQPLTESKSLNKAARQFAAYMAEHEKYGHQADGKTPAQRAKEAGYAYCVIRENIAYRRNPNEVTSEKLTETFVSGWVDSPEHRENMLAETITEVGVGVANSGPGVYYAVQLFGRPESASIEIEITNQSGEKKLLRSASNGNSDTIEMPPRTLLKMTRCFPVTLSVLQDGKASSELNIRSSSKLIINADGDLEQQESNQ